MMSLTGTRRNQPNRHVPAAPVTAGCRCCLSCLSCSAAAPSSTINCKGASRRRPLRLADDVISSYDLIERAAQATDRELFITVLSGADDEWTNAQISLLEEANLYDRQAFGLTWQGTATPVSTADVVLDEDLLGAELTATVRYATRQLDGSTAAIELLVPQVYRLSNQNRWLLAPPLSNYWGESHTLEGDLVQIDYFARDEAWAQTLSQAADDLLRPVCAANPGLGCDARSRFAVNLSNQPAAIRSATGLSSLTGSDSGVRLPTASLVGLPVDEQGEQELLRGYVRLILIGFLAERLAYDCCQRAIFLQATADYLLAEQGWQPYPEPLEAYEELLNGLNDIDLDGDRPVGSADLYLQGSEWPFSYSLVDFMLSQQITGEPADLLATLLSGESDTLWLREALGIAGSGQRGLNRAWYQFLVNKISDPAQNINWPTARQPQFYCNDGQTTGLRRYQLDPNLARLALAAPSEQAISQSLLAPLPSGDGVILQLTSNGPDTVGSFAIRYFDGRELTMAPPNDEVVQAYYVGQSTPDYQQLLFFFVSGPFSPDVQFEVYDLANCPDNLCQSRSVPYGSWAPDGRRFAFLDTTVSGPTTYVVSNDETDDEIRLVEEEASRFGTTPAWLDNETIAFFLDNELIRYGLPAENRELLFTLDDLIASEILPPLGDGQEIVITEVVGVPGGRDSVVFSWSDYRICQR